MNAISYITGDVEITDYPECCARPLATIVQWCNDRLAGPDGYLSPEDSVVALDLGWQTVRTADVGTTVVNGWVAQLLTGPAWGVVWNANNAAARAIWDIADLHRRAAAGDMPPVSAWYAADCAGQAACPRTSPGVGTQRTVCCSGGIPVDSVGRREHPGEDGRRHRQRAALPRTGSRRPLPCSRGGVLTRHAIASWRMLAGLEICGETSPVLTDSDVSPADIFA